MPDDKIKFATAKFLEHSNLLESKHSLWQHGYISLVMDLEQKTSGC